VQADYEEYQNQGKYM